MMPPTSPPPFFFFFEQFLATTSKLRPNISDLWSSLLQGCSSPLVVKFADTQRDKEQRRLQQQLVQQIQQMNSASTWGNLAGLGTLTPQYLAVSVVQARSPAELRNYSCIITWHGFSLCRMCSPYVHHRRYIKCGRGTMFVMRLNSCMTHWKNECCTGRILLSDYF